MTVKSVVVLVMLWVSLRNNFAAFLSLQAQMTVYRSTPA